MNWSDFFSDLFSRLHSGPTADKALAKPGTVMICFVNRYLEALDGVKYKIAFDGKELTGTTTATSYCFEIQPETLNPIKVSVWSRKSKAFKALDDVVPVFGQCKLVRKVLATAKVTTKTEKHPDTKPAAAPAPTLPPPPPPEPEPEVANKPGRVAVTEPRRQPRRAEPRKNASKKDESEQTVQPARDATLVLRPAESGPAPHFDREAAKVTARDIASELDTSPPKLRETRDEKLARQIQSAARPNCKDGIPGGLLAPLYLMMDKKDSGCKW